LKHRRGADENPDRDHLPLPAATGQRDRARRHRLAIVAGMIVKCLQPELPAGAVDVERFMLDRGKALPLAQKDHVTIA
jgi:hypothetical protein